MFNKINKKIFFRAFSILAILLLISSSLIAVINLYRPPIKEVIMQTQVAKNNRVVINTSQTAFKKQVTQAADTWNKDLKRQLFMINNHEKPTIVIYDLANKQIKQLLKNRDYDEHILAATGKGVVYVNASFMDQTDNRDLLVPVIEHELGHVIGLKHINGDALMNASIQPTSYITKYDLKVARYILLHNH